MGKVTTKTIGGYLYKIYSLLEDEGGTTMKFSDMISTSDVNEKTLPAILKAWGAGCDAQMPKIRPEAIKLDCGKHYGVRIDSESNHCYKCAKKRQASKHRPKWNMTGANYAKATKSNIPSKRRVKDNRNRGLDLFDNLR